MKYLKKFDKHSNYETFTGTTSFARPNVSICLVESDVHFNPFIEPYALKFSVESGEQTVIFLDRFGNEPVSGFSFEYSQDLGENWTEWDYIGTSLDITPRKPLYIRGINRNGLCWTIREGEEDIINDLVFTFGNSTPVYCSGNPLSLLDYSDKNVGLSNDCFTRLFMNCTALMTAPELPMTNLITSCYRLMFEGCTSLTKAPELPATSLSTACYLGMFSGCTALVQAPVLPAIELGEFCYSSMFAGCTSLTNAPALPAPVLIGSCYSNMFLGCTALVQAPVLPALGLVTDCYLHMFSGCTSLNYIKALFTEAPTEFTTLEWVKSVASDGTFVKNAEATWDVVGDNGVPEGWTVLGE